MRLKIQGFLPTFFVYKFFYKSFYKFLYKGSHTLRRGQFFMNTAVHEYMFPLIHEKKSS
jgi:hypothetical protein